MKCVGSIEGLSHSEKGSRIDSMKWPIGVKTSQTRILYRNRLHEADDSIAELSIMVDPENCVQLGNLVT